MILVPSWGLVTRANAKSLELDLGSLLAPVCSESSVAVGRWTVIAVLGANGFLYGDSSTPILGTT
ncbi:hypothetical protein Q31a_17010 [Aureliella helgolandensis]|uniref:Uncharacterized protein n=1 Tax=Aureliella helgolandensis TaxID=2527968 RepID=A0A518G484_9BACT|nr:hypothetical protein Q31a_17010 [Aureliella helgolandensis]